MRTKKEIEKEIEDMESDLLIMKMDKSLPEQRKQDAVFTQEQVIKALKWTIDL